MEDVVALIATSEDATEVALITWGRVHDSVDPRPLIAEIRRHHARFGFDFTASIELCPSLCMVSDFEYFFEGLLAFSGAQALDKSHRWRREKRAAIRDGDDIYKLGLRRGAGRASVPRSGSIVYGFTHSADSRETAACGLSSGDLQALIDGPVGRTLLRLRNVTGLAQQQLCDEWDRRTDRYALLIRTDLPDDRRLELSDKVLETYRFTLPRPELDVIWSFIDEEVYNAREAQAVFESEGRGAS